MKDKQARALAIVALVFMGIFIVALIATLVDHTLFGGGIGYVALGAGVMTFMIFIALKADGRGYSITKMKNDSEMEEIERAIRKKLDEEEIKRASADDGDGANAPAADEPDNAEQAPEDKTE